MILCVSEQEKAQILAALRYWQAEMGAPAFDVALLMSTPLSDGEITTLIDSLDTPDNSCHETLGMCGKHKYIRCGQPAVAIVQLRDPRPYLMCAMCTSHNVRNRGGKIIAVRPGEEWLVRRCTQSVLAVSR
jgi:hypothetical protein